MHYYKSQELADIYNISRRTVTNWIDQVQKGRLKLELYEDDGVFYIAKSTSNKIAIEKLVQDRRKYLNKRSLKMAAPKPEFYETYSEAQILDMIHNIEVHSELPLQYSYFGEGAEFWGKYAAEQRYSRDLNVGSLIRTYHLVDANTSYLEALFGEYDKVNVVDLGCGNGFPVKNLVSQLISAKKLNRYVAIDISPDMLKLAQTNMHEWFGDKVKFEGHIRDISYQAFADIIAEPPEEMTNRQKVINIVLLLGGTLSNFRSPSSVLRVIGRSMNSHDVFISSFKPSTTVNHDLDFIWHYQERCKVVLDMMGIDESNYEAQVGYERGVMRYGRIKLKHALTIAFKLPKGYWYIDLRKDDTILTVRVNDNDPFALPKDLFYANDFAPFHISQTIDYGYMMVMARLRRAEYLMVDK